MYVRMGWLTEVLGSTGKSQRNLPLGQHPFLHAQSQDRWLEARWCDLAVTRYLLAASSQRSCLLESEEDHHGSIPKSYTAGTPKCTQQLKVWRLPCHHKLPTP